MGEVSSKRDFYPIYNIKTGKKSTGSVSQHPSVRINLTDGSKIYFSHNLLALIFNLKLNY